jgi:regulator of sirC expression with transglutaminase-like and TPR domain
MPLNLSLSAPSPLDYFASLVQSDEEFALFEAAVSLAQDEYPDLDVQSVLEEVDQLLARIRRRIPADAMPMHVLRVFNRFFFEDLHFGGNFNDFYDPENSFVNVLLRTRRGIPISLAVLWMELAQGLGLAVRGVSFPGHFMVKVDFSIGQVVIDPVTGQSLSREELSGRLEPYLQQNTLADGSEVPLGRYLQPAAPREIIARMLGNLKEVHRTQRDWARLLAVQERLVVLLPQAWGEYRDRGLAHAELGHTAQALADLECYLLHAEEYPDHTDRNAITARLEGLKRRGVG